MKVKELREAIKDLPDEMEVFMNVYDDYSDSLCDEFVLRVEVKKIDDKDVLVIY